jgi:hypothetical protein
MNVTHGISMNGRIHGELKNPDLSPQLEVRRLVSLLDGSHRYSIVLWALPPGVPFDRVNHKSWPVEYIQAAGSSDRMLVEVRHLVDGAPQQTVVGRRNESPGELGVVVWDQFRTEVWANELFTADEAGDLFAAYYATGSVPRSYALRPLAL